MELSPATAATTRHLHLILAVAGYPPCHRTALQQPAGFIHDHTSPAYEIKGTNGHSCHHPPCSPHGFSSGGRIDGGKEARQRWICGRLRIAHIEPRGCKDGGGRASSRPRCARRPGELSVAAAVVARSVLCPARSAREVAGWRGLTVVVAALVAVVAAAALVADMATTSASRGACCDTGRARQGPRRHDLWRDTLVDAPSTTPTTRAARCTSRSAPPRPDLAGWRRRLAMVAADGGGWRRWRWRWRLATVAPVAVMVGRPSQPKGLTVCRRRRQHVEVGKETGCRRNVDGGKICGSGLGRIAEGTMCRPTTVLLGIAGESLAEPFGRLTTATPFGVVPLLGGVVLAYPSPFLNILQVNTLLRLPNERWRRSTSRPPWGHRFGETSSCKDVVDGLCICFEAFQP
uniref:Uncharacterized protein n=1 Tax=Oryza rufipogon TaxID=4529 RepID=A0A0E0QJ38_ORYRU